MSIIIKFYNVIIKSANVDKGGEGGKTLIHKMWIKIRFFFLNPSLTKWEFCGPDSPLAARGNDNPKKQNNLFYPVPGILLHSNRLIFDRSTVILCRADPSI